MCGLIGCISNHNYQINESNFSDINNLLLRRGPDNQSTLLYKNNINTFNFGHTRLSIQDLNERANQPMFSKNKNFILLFNGEIYNHLELRKKYLKNYSWESSSDTETILVLFENFGIEKCLQLIEGMFSIALYNKLTNELYLIRDRAGEKPLYIGLSENFLLFSSDTKTFLKFKNFDKSINLDAVNQYLKLNYIKTPLSIYNNAFKIPPGSFIKIDFNKYKFIKNIDFNSFINLKSIQYKKWWKINESNLLIDEKLDYNEAKKRVHEELTYSVKQQQISDVPIGVFLSGGIDSSLITSVMSSITSKINTFTIGFEDKNYNEAHYAKKISNYLGTNHTEVEFKKNDLLKIIPQLSNVYTEPFADSSQIPSLLLSSITSNKVKVALSGDGGDELFAGYNRYLYGHKYEKLFNNFPNILKNILLFNLKYIPKGFIKIIFKLILNNKINTTQEVNKIISKLGIISKNNNFYDAMISEWLPNDKLLNFNNFTEENIDIENKSDLNLVNYMMLKDFNSYLCDDILCKMDRASMYHSLEVRTPFLNKKLIEFCFSIPHKFKIKNNTSKYILKDLLSDYLPKDLYDRKKSGFAIPISKFLRNDLKDWAGDMLSKNVNLKHNLFNQNVIDKTFKDHIQGKINNEHKLWSLIQFNSWYQNIYNG